MSTIEAAFGKLTGSIALSVNAGSARIRLPENAAPEITHDDVYGLFTNKLSAYPVAATSDEPVRYTFDCSVKYGVVTLEN